ncbi:unnamed protein product [Symbiodinium sp. CCMP2592]|nr:unnamed protein product [Symbiodinium sp. CCMP2592]
MMSSRFRDGYNQALMAAAKAVQRRVVPNLPEGVVGTMRHNRELLSLCNDDLGDVEKQEEALAFFNGSWNSQGLVHWKALQSLMFLFASVPSPPLLYRWKHWEAAAAFALRGVLFHQGLFESLISAGAAFSGTKHDSESIEALIANAVLDLDDQDGDADIGKLQQVRLAKTLKLFRSGRIKVSCLR